MMENDKMMIPYIAYEAAQTRAERHIKALIKALIIAILLLFLSNAIWLYAWVQYDYMDTDSTIEVDAGSGTANYIGQDGDITNGTDQSTDTDTETDETNRE